jgi:hypothetical protein
MRTSALFRIVARVRVRFCAGGVEVPVDFTAAFANRLRRRPGGRRRCSEVGGIIINGVKGGTLASDIVS